jgi:hypothetical protein
VPGGYIFPNRARGQANAIFMGLDFLWYSDSHCLGSQE